MSRRFHIRPQIRWTAIILLLFAAGVFVGRYERDTPQQVGNPFARQRLNRFGWENMYPSELNREARSAGIAYVPLGAIEWHNEHLPLGTDSLKAHGLCLRLAQRTGGAVLPPSFVGIPFIEKWNEKDARAGAVRNAALEGTLPYSPALLQAFLMETLTRLDQMGFQVVVILTGHTPNEQMELVREAATSYMRSSNSPMVVLPFTDAVYRPIPTVQDSLERRKAQERLLIRGAELFGFAMDHAESWETSILWALMPPLVDIDRIGPEWPRPGPKCVRTNASRARGEECIGLFVDMAAPFIVSQRDTVRSLRPK